jgi:hypothetical protein
MTDQNSYSAAWRQFLLAKRTMLAEYDRALSHAKTQVVSTHHGNVAEAAVRDWLATFLPKRYGVTSGYIRSQGFGTGHQSPHFDVIVYDQLEAPTLWIEENRDKSDGGRARIIPAEHVGAIVEVKSAFSRRTVSEAMTKLHELDRLMAGLDDVAERYPRYLRPSAVLAMLFFELRAKNSSELATLEMFRAASFGRAFYGGVILRGEGRDPDDTARVQQMTSDQVMEPMFPEAGLLHQVAMAGTETVAGQLQSAMLMWSTLRFSDFAFDLLALLNGTYQQGRASSLHGLDFTDWKRPPK